MLNICSIFTKRLNDTPHFNNTQTVVNRSNIEQTWVVQWLIYCWFPIVATSTGTAQVGNDNTGHTDSSGDDSCNDNDSSEYVPKRRNSSFTNLAKSSINLR